jgi:hypothetical protein
MKGLNTIANIKRVPTSASLLWGKTSMSKVSEKIHTAAITLAKIRSDLKKLGI